MRTPVLLAVLLIVSGAYVATRGVAWHYGYLIPGAALGVLGTVLLALLLSPRSARHAATTEPGAPRKSLFQRCSRGRLQRALLKASARAEAAN